MLQSYLTLPGLALGLACVAFGQAGTTFCSATNNSTGSPALLTGTLGTGIGSDLHLEVSGGVPTEFGYLLAGNEITSGVMISSGMNCLIGTPTAQMFRYNVAGTDAISLGFFDGSGLFQNLAGTSTTGSGFDVPRMIPAGVPYPILSGDTWNFQLWYRDTALMTGASNFSSGLSVTFNYPAQPVPTMVLISGGDFQIGSTAGFGAPYNGDNSTQPVHDVTISQDFWMGAYEVTQAEYEGLMGVNPSTHAGSTKPVENVNWAEARLYCATLTAQEDALGNLPAGLEYRLPTEAEWEFACRAGTTTEFFMGPAIQCGEALFGFNQHTVSSCQSYSTEIVGSFTPNTLGLYDMHGNVGEWCLDTYGDYSAGPVTDPLATGGVRQITRGGGFSNSSAVCRSAYRYHQAPTYRNANLGFRVVLGAILMP